jgi:hypothetical protein
VLTAPIPGVSTPSFPFGGATLTGLRIRFLPVRLEVVKKAAAAPLVASRSATRAPRSFLSVARFTCGYVGRNHHSAANDSEQTIYDAATRKDLQIESGAQVADP